MRKVHYPATAEHPEFFHYTNSSQSVFQYQPQNTIAQWDVDNCAPPETLHIGKFYNYLIWQIQSKLGFNRLVNLVI